MSRYGPHSSSGIYVGEFKPLDCSFTIAKEIDPLEFFSSSMLDVECSRYPRHPDARCLLPLQLILMPQFPLRVLVLLSLHNTLIIMNHQHVQHLSCIVRTRLKSSEMCFDLDYAFRHMHMIYRTGFPDIPPDWWHGSVSGPSQRPESFGECLLQTLPGVRSQQ